MLRKSNQTTLKQNAARKRIRVRGALRVFPLSAERQLRMSGRMILVSDIIALALAFALGGLLAWAINVYVLDDGFQQLLSHTSAKQFMLFMALGCTGLLWLDQQGHYRQRLPFWETVGHVIITIAVGLLVGGFIQYAAKNDFSRLWLGLSWLMFGGLLFLGRMVTQKVLHARGLWRVPVLLLGNDQAASALRAALRSDRTMGYTIVSQADDVRVSALLQPQDWHALLLEKKASYVMIALEGAALQASQAALKALARSSIPFAIVPPLFGLPVAGVSPHSFFTNDAVLLYNTNRLALPLPRLMKRSFDVVVAGLLVLFISPLLLIIALLIKRDGGPAMFTQPRVGMDGKHFGCFKLRSMVVDADKKLQSYLAENPAAAAEWQQYQKLKHDPRITAVGRFIRRTSVDELPQLLNVLKGDMSLVGPRPIMPDQKSFYGDDFSYYTAVRPGITGPWQVSGRNALSFDERVQLEAWYARNWSLWMDIVILLKTPQAVLDAGKTS